MFNYAPYFCICNNSNGVEIGITIAITTSIFSVCSVVYTNFRNDIRLRRQLLFDKKQKSLLNLYEIFHDSEDSNYPFRNVLNLIDIYISLINFKKDVKNLIFLSNKVKKEINDFIDYFEILFKENNVEYGFYEDTPIPSHDIMTL